MRESLHGRRTGSKTAVSASALDPSANLAVAWPAVTAIHDDPVIRPIAHFAGTRDHAVPTDRLRDVRRAARTFREELLCAPPVPLYQSFDVTKVPYPTKYGLRDACPLPFPYIHILNRLFVVQFPTQSGIKTLLAEPLDRIGNAETPFFKEIARPLGGAEGRLANMLYPELNAMDDILAQLGLRPEDIDYITYDHLHTQDVRKWLGTGDREAYFPKAKLLVMRREWEETQGPLPLHAAWYPPHGTEGVPLDRVILLDDDVMLGDSVALVRTPGHTEGNHSIVVRTEGGIFVTSENGVAVDSWAPERSRIPGVARWARATGCEVLLNANTLENSIDQYVSMVLEKELAGPSARNADFPNVAPSSEMSAHILSPGLAPTFTVGELNFGAPAAGGVTERPSRAQAS
jgi:hypothetical protein